MSVDSLNRPYRKSARRSVTGRYVPDALIGKSRPKLVDHRIEKRPFDVRVLMVGGSPLLPKIVPGRLVGVCFRLGM